jgi:molecular chaperone DnaK
MVREAAEHAEEDRARRAATESRNEADALVYQGERLLKDLDDKLSDEEKAEVNARIEAVREALKGDDTGAVDSTKGQLAEVLQRIGTKAYEASGSADGGNGTDGAAGADGSDGAEAASEDEGETIEGEYKEV